MYAEVVPTEDGQGVIWNVSWFVNGKKQISTVCVFYNSSTNSSHGISQLTSGTVHYPEKGKEVLQRNSLDGTSTTQTTNIWITDDKVDTEVLIQPKGQSVVKGWGSFHRRK